VLNVSKREERTKSSPLVSIGLDLYQEAQEMGSKNTRDTKKDVKSNDLI